MSTQVPAQRSRRALLAAAAGAAAATVATSIGRPATVLAGSDGDVVLGAENVAQATTTLVNGTQQTISVLETRTGGDGYGFQSHADSGIAIVGHAESGDAVYAFSMDGIALNGEGVRGTALLATGRVRFSRSGRVVVEAGRSAVTVDLRALGGLAGSPLCFATIQGYRPGMWVAGARPNYPRPGRMRIYLNRRASTRCRVAWVVLDALPLA